MILLRKLYFLVQPKRAQLSPVYLALFFFTTCVRSTIGYAIPVFYNALPQYLINELVSIKKRAISIIILPESSYSDT